MTPAEWVALVVALINGPGEAESSAREVAHGALAAARRCGAVVGYDAELSCQRTVGHPAPCCGCRSACDNDTHNDVCRCARPFLDVHERCVCGGFP